MSRSRSGAPLQAPRALPPETRTVGQLVAEALRLYGRRFWPSLALGLGPAVLTVLTSELERPQRFAVTTTVGGLLLSSSYVAAAALAGRVPSRRRAALALAAGVLVFAPFPFLVVLFILPGLAWLALVGLVVPVLVLEERSFRASFGRALELGRADFVHALGSLATLAIVVFLTQAALFFVLRGTGDQTMRIAGFLASLVVSPVLFLGSALLYFDQAARVVSSRRNR